MSDYLNEVTEKVNKAIMNELSTKGYCYGSYAENILRRELGLPQITLGTNVGWTADSDAIGTNYLKYSPSDFLKPITYKKYEGKSVEEVLDQIDKNKVKENKMANIKDESYIIPSISERICIEPFTEGMFRTTVDAINDAIATTQSSNMIKVTTYEPPKPVDAINDAIATTQSSNAIKVTTDAPPKLYEPSYTFDCRTAQLNMEAFNALCKVPTVKENTKKEKENKMKKDEPKPVYNTEPKTVKYDEYAGYSVLGIKVLAANKVVVVTIGEKTLPTIAVPNGSRNVHTYKQICREPDVFDLKYAVALALTKHLHRHPGTRLTTYGLERMTEYNLAYSYDFNKEVDRALKAYARCEREEAMAKAKAEEIKKIKERRAAKQKRNRERRRERRMNGQS